MKNLFTRKQSNHVNTPTVLQMEASECGAASLSIILSYYGLWLPLEILRQECGVNRDGVSASNIVKAARLRGCEAVGYRWPVSRLLQNAEFPLLIHWEFNHFVVLEGVDKDNAYLNDPAVGHRVVPMENFITSYTGIALSIRPGKDFVPSGEKYNVVKVIAKKLQQDKWSMLFVTIVCLCMIVPQLATPVFGQVFLDDILTGKHKDWLFNLMLMMVGTFIIQSILTWLRAWCLTKWQAKLTLSDSSRFFWHILQLPMEFFQQRFSSEVASRVAFTEEVAGVLTGSAATVVLDFFIAVFYLVLLLHYNVALTIIGVAFSLVGVVVFLLVRSKVLEMSMKLQQDAGKEYGVAVNGLQMMETLKANGNEEEFFCKWAGYKSKVLAGSQKIALYNMTVQMLPILLAGVNTALIMTIGGFAIMDGLMTAGIFVAFQSLMSNFQAPFNNILNLADTLQTTEMQMKRLDDVMKYEKDTLNYPEEQPADIGRSRLWGEVEMKNLVFGYSTLHKPLFPGFNMHLKPGEWVALVGGSGCGKSTLAKIITGIYKEWRGELLFDGIPREKIPHGVICNSVASVDQDVFLLSGTIEENITLFDSSIRHSDVVRAAKDACIHDDILRLDGGYEHMVAEGGFNFSGGQRQRLEIARALAVNPSILVLDEATSALDPLTELKVMENIRRRGCTCIVVAHRLSTIRDCDEIIVIDHGNIVERGTHTEMLKANGPYAKLIGDNSGSKEGEA